MTDSDEDDDASFASADEEGIEESIEAGPVVGLEATEDLPKITNEPVLDAKIAEDINIAHRLVDDHEVTAGTTSKTLVECKGMEEESDQVVARDTSEYVHKKDSCTADDVKQGPAEEKTDDVSCKDPRSALERLTTSEKPDVGGKGWGWSNLSSWGTSVISSATSSVGTFTNQVGAGLHQVLQTVEAGFDETVAAGDTEKPQDTLTPDNEKGGGEVITKQVDRVSLDDASDQSERVCETVTADSAAEGDSLDKVERQNVQQPESKGDDGDSWFAGWGLSGIVQQTTSASKKVVTGGLDVLETIGKKTFDILTEGDHGLKKVIEDNRSKKPNLSQSLREAKEEAERQAKEEQEFLESRRANFGAQFDDHQGLVQLEALEMLSSTSESQLKKILDVLTDEQMDGLQAELMQVKTTFDNTSVDSDEPTSDADWNFQKLVLDYRGRLPLNISVQKLLSTDEEAMSWLQDFDNIQKSDHPWNSKDIHHKAIECIAMLTAYTIEHFHRVSLLIMQDNTAAVSSTYCHMTTFLSDLTRTVCEDVNCLSAQFVKCTTALESSSDEPVKEIVTNIYLESSNSCSYIHNAFQLLCPVLQLAVVKSHPLCKDLLDK